jgi:hypothetical protein
MVSFELTMPNVGSWNGKWTGADQKYFLIKNLSKSQLANIPFKDGRVSFYYNFGDGWGANVAVELVDAKEAKRRRKNSKGFASYDWMVDEIIEHGRILSRDERLIIKNQPCATS